MMKFGKMRSLWMLEMLVELVCQDEKLASASFTRIQFWTETSMACLVDLKDENRADLLELRFWLEGPEDGRVSKLMELERLGLQL